MSRARVFSVSMEKWTMSRTKQFLMVTWDGGGNFPPEIALVRRLTERGHEVRVMSHEPHADRVQEAGAIFRPFVYVADRDSKSRSRERLTDEAERVEMIKNVWMNPDFSKDLLAEVDRQRPDVLLVDASTTMALIAAEQSGLPTVVLWHTLYGAFLDSPIGQTNPVQLRAMNALREEVQLDPVSSSRDMFERAQLVFAFTYPSLDIVPKPLAPNVHYVGPMVAQSSEAAPYRIGERLPAGLPLVLLSFSTTFQRQVEGLQKVLDALEPLPVRVLVTLGPAVAARELRIPDNTIAEQHVDHRRVLPQASLVVTHAGHSTVMAAVSHGVPMVCMPMGRDQHIVASRVQAEGLGMTVSVDDTPEEIRAAIESVLRDEVIRKSTARFRDEIDPRASADSAVALVEALA